MPTAYPGALDAPKRGWRGLSALLAGLLTALLVVTGVSATPAMAAPTGTVVVEFPGAKENSSGGAPVYVEGEPYKMTVSYDNKVVPGGHEVTIVVPKGFTIKNAPADNSSIESFLVDADGNLTVKFKDPISVPQGFFEIDLVVDSRTDSSLETVEWGVKGNEETKTIVIREKDDNLINFDRNASAKNAFGATWPEVKVVDGQVVLGEDFLNTEIPFAVTVWNKDQPTISIADQLGPNLTLVPTSFKMTQTKWDANGLNKKVADVPVGPFSGTNFTIDQPADANSIYDLRYSAKITDAAALENVRALLQAQYEGVKDTENAEFKIKLTNSATVQSETHGTETWITGRTPVAPKPDIGAAFGKGNNLPWNTAIETEEDGITLVKPLPVTYDLKADLTRFKDFENTKYALTRNVVMTDTLPEQLRWLTDGEFLTLDGTKLQKVEGVSAEDFADDNYALKYMVDGQTLMINAGRDVTKNYTFKAKAELYTVKGLSTTEKPGDNPYAAIQFSRITNLAQWTYSGPDGVVTTKDTSTDHQLYIPKDKGATVDDKNKFDKTAPEKIQVKKGTEFVEIPFTFSVGKNVGNALTSSVIDQIDHSTLNVTEKNLDEIKATITGTYGSTALTGKMFDLSLNEDNNLVFTPNKNFPRDQNSDEARDAFTFTATLHTKPLEGNTALTVKNSASYVGSDIHYVYTSVTVPKAGVIGGEMDVTKTVYNEDAKEFTTNLRVEVDEDTQTLTKSEFVYRIQLLPTMDFTKVLFDLDDVLDPRLELLGFVDPKDFATGNPTPSNSYKIPGTNVTVSVSTNDQGKKQIRVPKGEQLVGGDVTEFFFKVKMTDFSYGEGIENAIGSKKATITPTNDFPLDISKLDSIVPDGEPITDRTASFELVDADGAVVLKDMYVVGGKLRIAGKDGKDLVPTVKKPGVYKVREIKAPAGYMKSEKEISVTVGEDGTSKEAKFLNVPRSSIPKVSVGDYVWIDVDADGIQKPGNDIPLENVLLRLTDPDGKPVTNIDGTVVEDRYTDANGFYEFTDLPPLEAGKSYTVTIVQDDSKTKEALKGLVPTLEGVGDDRGADSSTWSAKSGDLVKNGAKDYTLDFGFQYKTYAIGDVVWIDTNKDGLQDKDEAPLAGVTVYLLDQDGNRVKDADGADIARVTDDKGHYLFDGLRAGTYGVEFVLTEAQSTQYQFTKQNGGDVALDSNADPKTGKSTAIVLNDKTPGLVASDKYNGGKVTATQGIDPTWDAGVIVKSVSVGDYVWFDENRDGIQDDGEPGIKGVKLVLVGPDGKPVTDVFGKPVEPAVTDGKGFYEFVNLPALKEGEKYTVAIDREDEGTKEALKGLTPTKIEGTKDEEKDSSTWTAENRIDLVNDGTHDPSLDFGFQKKSYAVGDYVWIDANNDGLQGDDELPLAGVTVKLLDEKGGVLLETLTNTEGRYIFDELAAGTYQVQFELTKEQAKKYQFTKQAGGDTALDSDAGDKGLSKQFTLDDSTALVLDGDYTFASVKATEGIDPTWDAGVIVKKVSVGDYVWLDKNRDGVQDENEAGIPGVVLELVGPDGKPVTDVFGNPVGPVTTDEKGHYSFDNLPALVKGETYTVKIVQDHESTVKALEGLVPTKEEGTKDPEKDSSTWTAESRDDLVSDGDRDPSLDFGFQHKSYAIGDVVWIDTDRDGLQGKDEAPLAGVTVYLLDENGDRITDADGNEVFRVTDDNGRYLFDELRAGTYGVEFVLTEAQAKQYQFTIQGGDAARDSDADPKTGKSAAIVLNDTNAALMSGKEYGIGTVKATQGIDPTWDAGVIVKSVSVGDYVWLDQDRNGVQNDGEQGIEGVKLVLLDPQGNVVTTDKDGNPFTNDRTDEKGHYSFTNLPALSKGETYTVRIDREDEGTKAALFGKLPTVEKGTEDREKDSSTWTAVSRDDLVNDGEEDLSLDFGFYSEKVTVGDYVWLDKNRDGIQDEGETPIPGVKLEILGPDGKPVTDIFGEPVAPVVTDENGEYLFENLPVLKPGEKYTVKIDREDEGTKEALKGLTPTKEKGTKDESKDSSTWTAESGELVKDGDEDLTLDFGFQEKSYAVGDVVWIDTNKDGLQDDTEYTLADVKVRLFEEVVNENGEVEAVLVGETTTNKQGLYVFDELPAGKYRVQFELTPAQAKIYKFTKYAAGKTALDSNAGENGFSEWFILDDTNEALVTDYEYSDYVGGIKATQGIDPTWDAGVIVLNTPTPGPGPEPVDPTEPGTPEHPKGGTTIGGLANTGGMELWGYFAGGAALLLLGAGALLVSGRRREARHG